MSKKIIYGDTVGTPMSRPDWAEKNERSASYIKNKPKALERLGEIDGCVPAVVNEYDAMLELDDDIVLCYVAENCKRRIPITLEAGVVYDEIYIDPRMPNFFPCEPFTVTIETRYGYRSEFITDGLTYFMEKEYDDVGKLSRVMLFNNTDNDIVIDGKIYPPAYKTDVADFSAWSAWQARSYITNDNGESILNPNPQPTSLEKHVDNNWFVYNELKFTTNQHHASLENIFSAEDTHEVVRGFYQRMWDGWHRLNDRGFEDIQIGLQSVTEKAHTHDVSDDDNGNVTINLASGDSSGGGIIIGPNGGLEIQSIDIIPTEPMKTLTIDNSTYEIVDSEARERLTTIENQGGGSLPVAYINEDGELIFEIGGGVTDAWINDRGELEVELS